MEGQGSGLLIYSSNLLHMQWREKKPRGCNCLWSGTAAWKEAPSRNPPSFTSEKRLGKALWRQTHGVSGCMWALLLRALEKWQGSCPGQDPKKKNPPKSQLKTYIQKHTGTRTRIHRHLCSGPLRSSGRVPLRNLGLWDSFGKCVGQETWKLVSQKASVREGFSRTSPQATGRSIMDSGFSGPACLLDSHFAAFTPCLSTLFSNMLGSRGRDTQPSRISL